ncbi:MAG: hypothetical protein HY952_03045 [Elusimicrobia bacterium]|nr:hypothetical protein [Elusimicrobiota bacterium]
MKKIFFPLMLCAVRLAAEPPKYAVMEGVAAAPLAADNAYFRSPENPAPDYWNLSAFYVPQYNNYSCSAASLAMALNALANTRRARGDGEKNLEPRELAGKVTGFPWKDLLEEAGSEGRHGVTLAQLAAAAKETLAAYGIKAAVLAVEVPAQTAQGLEKFRRALAGNERSPDDIMLLYFAQDAVTGAPGGPYAHISPVGAYDAKTRRVLVMDVDREWYEPYWAPETLVYKAMSVKTPLGAGGYVILRRSK